MENRKIAWVKVTFTDHANLNNDPEHILELVTRSWKEIDQAMRPMIGKGGIEALFHRSIEFTTASYPWLSAVSNDAYSAVDLDLLQRVLSEQDTRHLADASDTLLVHFHYLLTNLIGLSLTDRLLRPALDPLLNGTVAKDI